MHFYMYLQAGLESKKGGGGGDIFVEIIWK